MRTRAATYVRFLAVFAILGSLGTAASIYVLVHERVALPFRDVHTVDVEFSEADGVIQGIGQPVNVAGVKVGQIAGVELHDGRARVKLELQRDQVPEVYENASAVLEPITPLEDMQIALDPGAPPARPLAKGEAIPISRTRPPVPASDLLARLDTDTRDYLSTLISSLGAGTAGRAADIRRTLLALGPTTAQVGRLNRALDARRTELARLVTNLARVTRAASRDGRLDDVVASGSATLAAIAREEAPLRAAIRELPPTLNTTRATLQKLGPFAAELGPTLRALMPAVDRLPATLRQLDPFAALGEQTLRKDVRPLVRDALPLVGSLSYAIPDLARSTPNLASGARSINYFFNELAYNPPAKDDEGFLFWGPWAGHNINSMFSAADAHGNLSRAVPFVNCASARSVPGIAELIGAADVCPD
jgi:phospholipid/cholesterol/gamma-HCH transport system substrate-binding protein